jgi:hypothetical protein
VGRVGNDWHDCARRIDRSVGWAVAWATLYLAPVALVVFAVQRAHRGH